MGTGTHAGSSGDTRDDRATGRPDIKVGDRAFGYACQTCNAARDYGAAKIRSEVEAGKHRRRFPHHVVACWERKITYLFGEQTEPLITTTDDDVPPF